MMRAGLAVTASTSSYDANDADLPGGFAWMQQGKSVSSTPLGTAVTMLPSGARLSNTQKSKQDAENLITRMLTSAIRLSTVAQSRRDPRWLLTNDR
jgi:hypothetical protein